jgi:general secretion pathway protein K
MRIPPPRQDRGIALIIVMMVILVLAVLAGSFAYSMKVETKLARNTSYESEMEWLGRSGVERGKWLLSLPLLSPPPESMYTGGTQPWAVENPGSTNELYATAKLKKIDMGVGIIDISIIDLERKFSLTAVTEANSAVLERALALVGADSSDIPTIIDSYLDWVDPDNKTHLGGAENSDYLAMKPAPYYCKNGFVDDMHELLLLKGMNEQIFWGTKRVGEAPDRRDARGREMRMKRPMSPDLAGLQASGSGVGLIDLFVPFHGAGAMVNINTASAEVLQLIPGLPPDMAQAIARERNGPDGQAGTEDDLPYINVGEALQVAGADPAMAGAMRNMLTVQSRVFEITVDAQIGNYKRRFVALVNRQSAKEITTLYFTWK